MKSVWVFVTLFLSVGAFAGDGEKCIAGARSAEEEKRLRSIFRDADISLEVPGHFESVPLEKELVGREVAIRTQKFNFEDGFFCTTQIHDGSEDSIRWGISRRYYPDEDRLVFEDAVLQDHYSDTRAPSVINVDGVVPLIAGKGSPLSELVTLLQMKLMGIAKGSLKWADAKITNSVAIMELVSSPKFRRWVALGIRPEGIRSESIAEMFLQTSAARYLVTPLIQSGHRILGFKVTKIKWGFQDLSWSLKSYQSEEYKKLIREIPSELVKKEGTFLPSEIFIEFELGPSNHRK